MLVIFAVRFSQAHTGRPLGEWSEALFSVEAENEAFGHAKVTPKSAHWMCR